MLTYGSHSKIVFSKTIDYDKKTRMLLAADSGSSPIVAFNLQLEVDHVVKEWEYPGSDQGYTADNHPLIIVPDQTNDVLIVGMESGRVNVYSLHRNTHT